MDEIKNKDFDEKFYESLRKSQPIAFLASLSMVIAAFTHSNNDTVGVYNSAVLATIMFLLSFAFSLFDQLFPKNPKEDNTWRTGGKYFFFAFGILFLGLVAYEFGKPLPQASTIAVYWIAIAVGISFLITVIKEIGKHDPTRYGKTWQHKIVQSCGTIASLSIIGIGIVPIVNDLVTIKMASGTVTQIQFILGFSAAFFFILEFIFIKQYFKFANK